MSRIPFQIPEVHGGLSEADGIVYLEDEFLVFDVRVSTLGGLIDQRSEKIKAEVTVIEEARLERGFFSDRLCFVPRKLELLSAVPGTHKGELKLKVSKSHRDQIEHLIDTLYARKRSAAKR
jgi:hypothetical protein